MWRPVYPALVLVMGLALCGLPTPLGSVPGPASPRGKRACKPDCRGKRCGDDGCGSTCGRCGAGKSCYRERCVKRPKDPCSALYGTWAGAMYLSTTHWLRGKVWGTRRACFGRFRITFPLAGGRGTADETFTITFRGKRVYFKGTRILRSSPGSRYGLDNFSGKVDARRGRFEGVFHDGRRNLGRVVLTRK